MKKLIDRLFTLKYASFLLIATVIVSAPRYMGAFGQIVGVDLTRVWTPFVLVEIWSGLAMGMLEALVLEYIFHRLQLMEKWTIYWWISVALAAVILLTFPFIVAPYMMAVMNGVLIKDVLNGAFRASLVFWLWTFLVASLIPLIATAIGIVRASDDRLDAAMPDAQPAFAAVVRKAQAGAILDQWQQSNGTATPKVAWLIEEFGRLIGGALPESQADAAIVEWRSRNGIAGRRPKEESERVVAERVMVERSVRRNGD